MWSHSGRRGQNLCLTAIRSQVHMGVNERPCDWQENCSGCKQPPHPMPAGIATLKIMNPLRLDGCCDGLVTLLFLFIFCLLDLTAALLLIIMTWINNKSHNNDVCGSVEPPCGRLLRRASFFPQSLKTCVCDWFSLSQQVEDQDYQEKVSQVLHQVFFTRWSHSGF